MKSSTIYSNDFNRLLDATKAFVKKNENVRKHFCFIKLEFSSEKQEVTAIAVDGYRMSVEHAVISNCDEDFVAYIKPTIRLPQREYATISLMDDGKIAQVECNGFLFGYEQPNQNDFDWRSALPQGAPIYEIAFNGNLLLSAIQAAKVSAGNSFKTPLVLQFFSPMSPVLIRTNTHDIKMVLPVRYRRKEEGDTVEEGESKC